MSANFPVSSVRVAAGKPTIPILVGITGKRKSKLEALGVSELLVRTKLSEVLVFLDSLAPLSPKILLCGMADGVDEIAARLLIEAIGEDGDRQFKNWSIVGLLPLPEDTFVEDFDANAGESWWYRELSDKQRSFVRMMPLQTLCKPASPGGRREQYGVDELRRLEGSSNQQRTDHYEQLGLVLAERSTILIAVMPEGEKPDRPGGTAQVVGHRINGWRPDWPTGSSRDVAGRSLEFLIPPALAESGSRDTWLVPIGQQGGRADSVGLRVIHHRGEFDSCWPTSLQGLDPQAGFLRRAAARVRTWWRSLFPDPDVFVPCSRRSRRNALGSCVLLRAIERFNSSVMTVPARKPPPWDNTIAAHPSEPVNWSPIAAAERMRGALSDFQVGRKARVQTTAKWLGAIAWVSIAILEVYGEQFKQAWFLPALYVLLVGSAIVLFAKARKHLWAAIAEDYRMVSEALRVQISWWHFGLVERKERVDQLLLRYDAREFKTLRQGLSTVLDAIEFTHARHQPVVPGISPPAPVMDWVGKFDPQAVAERGGKPEPKDSGQILYQRRTAQRRNASYNRFDFFSWLCFGISLGMGICLAAIAGAEAITPEFVHGLAEREYGPLWMWLFPIAGLVAFAAIVATAIENLQGSPESIAFRRLVWSALAGFVGSAVGVGLWHMHHWPPQHLHAVLTLGTLLFLAAAGAIRYVAERLAIEAEAQGATEALIVYSRARRALDQVGTDYAANLISADTARARNEQIIRELGHYALVETEGWLRSHRERPLQPAPGS